MKEDLKPRIINHYESQIKYHERQVARCIIDLARISMLYSGQLRLDIEEASGKQYASVFNMHDTI
jgi:hypothetical protein